MSLYNDLVLKKNKLAVIGLGYVGLPLAIAFAKNLDVIGFDQNEEKINNYLLGYDSTKEVGDEAVLNSSISFTSDETTLKEAKFIIIAVPTPVNPDHTPNLNPIIEASRIVGRNLSLNSTIVYESTVFPGVTEEICLPILEQESKLQSGIDFKVGYSPERINPGDHFHKLDSIIKIVSGMDEQSLNTIAQVYELIINAGVYKAETIRIAEAAKVIENSQRDINIAFMNELSIIFHKMNIDTQQVLKAAATKWNFLSFTPGLVGGHCIGVDPYYLTYKAEQMGYHSQIILAGRRINDNMGNYIATHLVKALVQANIAVKNAKVAILGFTFKENCPDTRNTKVIDIVNELTEYGIYTLITDCIANESETYKEYNFHLINLTEIKNVDAVIIAVPHKQYQSLSISTINQFYKPNIKKVLFDLKGIFNKDTFNTSKYIYWRL